MFRPLTNRDIYGIIIIAHYELMPTVKREHLFGIIKGVPVIQGERQALPYPVPPLLFTGEEQCGV